MVEKIAIIGGAGFIGYNLTVFFADKGYSVKVISRSVFGDKFNIKNVDTTVLNANDTAACIDYIQDCETVIWLATASIPSTNSDTLIDDFKFNVDPIIRFLEEVKKTSVKRFIYLSSGGTIYGDSKGRTLLDESSPKNPISGYGLSKIISEKYIRFLTNNSSLQSFILRPSNVYGAHQNLIKPQGIIGFAFKAVLQETSIDLYNDGAVTRDFIYVTDLANAVLKCIESDYRGGNTSIYNVGSEKGYTIKEILKKIDDVSKGNIVTINKSARSFDCNYNVLSSKKIEKDFNWKPEVSIEDGLQKVWEWIKNDVNEK